MEFVPAPAVTAPPVTVQAYVLPVTFVTLYTLPVELAQIELEPVIDGVG